MIEDKIISELKKIIDLQYEKNWDGYDSDYIPFKLIQKVKLDLIDPIEPFDDIKLSISYDGKIIALLSINGYHKEIIYSII